MERNTGVIKGMFLLYEKVLGDVFCYILAAG